jgi:hypothetical protein
MDLSDCRDACTKTHLICAQTAVHVLVKGEEHPRDLVRALWDCSDICITAANLLTRGSPLHMTTCRACAEICEACVEACSGRDDPILRACVDACRDCARRCQQMAAAHPGQRHHAA